MNLIVVWAKRWGLGRGPVHSRLQLRPAAGGATLEDYSISQRFNCSE